MGNNKKRPHTDHHRRLPPIPPSNKKPHHHQSTTTTTTTTTKRPVFSSYKDTPDLAPKVKLLCEIIAATPSLTIERVLDDTGIRVSQPDVEDVLKLSYAHPGSSVKFFRWSGHQLSHKHSPYAWNLVVDLLGKNSHFDPMWDAIKSMHKEGLLSLATFASVFSSYVIAGRVKEAIMTFEVMGQYGITCDVIALNSLLSAICRDGKTVDAVDFLRVVKGRIRPDADSYAILLEGWENEGNVTCARQTFAEMVLEVGWDPENVPAYDSFLSTLIKGGAGFNEGMKFFETIKDRGCYPGVKFFKVVLEDCTKNYDVQGAKVVWNMMVGRIGFRPDTQMYNSMIALYCYNNDAHMGMQLLDEMVYNGVFPDAETYNLLFQFLIKSRKLKEASLLFNEMIKNEFAPNRANCNAAVRVFIEAGEAYSAIKIWRSMNENYDSDLEESGNILVVGLRDLDMVPEAVKYAEGMIDKGIKLDSSSLSKLKQSLIKMGKGNVYDELLRKWKVH
ncbi:PPR domain-containing protein/PPR_2 domain-containing protein [Cephalotus follicularis]|uniref:PPR domain-containing protein/PPR_2 domain-containing protein n=1 Tax=Cephalotus follicularis TaxID=3775 RepID=A0A1Q3BYN8_CEPFO|nr:PPR domain-containing protein/PPR_2 domain-containing protein [Cephalotus follicularis]